MFNFIQTHWMFSSINKIWLDGFETQSSDEIIVFNASKHLIGLTRDSVHHGFLENRFSSTKVDLTGRKRLRHADELLSKGGKR
jgi:hypothetical protein